VNDAVQTNSDSGGATQRPPLPIVTYIVIGACVAVFVWAFVDRSGMETALLRPMLRGAWWTLLSCTLIHSQNPTHIVFNLLAFNVLGRIVEWTIGSLRFALLLLATAWVSSFSQIYIEHIPGIGLSGVVYAVFGFILGASPTNPYFMWFVKKNAPMLIGWAVLCLVLTQTKIMGIANTAHFSGLFYGAICGLIYGLPKYRFVFLALSILVALGTVVLLYTPVS
jgi:membrane associated rhomboid family serine protease